MFHFVRPFVARSRNAPLVVPNKSGRSSVFGDTCSMFIARSPVIELVGGDFTGNVDRRKSSRHGASAASDIEQVRPIPFCENGREAFFVFGVNFGSPCVEVLDC